jgi:hypothetical protein
MVSHLMAYELSGPKACVNVSSCDSSFGLVCVSVGSDKERVLKCGLMLDHYFFRLVFNLSCQSAYALSGLASKGALLYQVG